MKFKKYNDPGHGWLAVPRKFLIESGVFMQISRYSYQKGNTVYLEEDGDMSIFLRKMKEKGISVEIEHKNTNKNSPIRYYKSFERSVKLIQLEHNFCFDVVDITGAVVINAENSQDHLYMAEMLGFVAEEKEIVDQCADAWDFLHANIGNEFII